MVSPTLRMIEKDSLYTWDKNIIWLITNLRWLYQTALTLSIAWPPAGDRATSPFYLPYQLITAALEWLSANNVCWLDTYVVLRRLLGPGVLHGDHRHSRTPVLERHWPQTNSLHWDNFSGKLCVIILPLSSLPSCRTARPRQLPARRSSGPSLRTLDGSQSSVSLDN